MSRFQIWPLAKMEDGKWSVPEGLLENIWIQMCREGRASRLFYTGHIRELADWLDWCYTPANLMQFVIDSRTKKFAAVTWLNNVRDGVAEAHFCMLGPPHPELGEAVLSYWSALPGVVTIVGCTPEHYTTAIKYAKRIGFKECGIIPNALRMAYENRRAGAVMTHYQTGKE